MIRVRVKYNRSKELQHTASTEECVNVLKTWQYEKCSIFFAWLFAFLMTLRAWVVVWLELIDVLG